MTTVVNMRDLTAVVGAVRGGRAGQGGRWHMHTASVGQPGWIGNPFRLEDFPGETREQVIERFRVAFLAKVEADERFRRSVLSLRGKKLACWCVRRPWTPADGGPFVCHLQVVAAWIDAQEETDGR